MVAPRRPQGRAGAAEGGGAMIGTYLNGVQEYVEDIGEMREALEAFVDVFEDPHLDGLADLNEAYEKACAALGREPVEIDG